MLKRLRSKLHIVAVCVSSLFVGGCDPPVKHSYCQEVEAVYWHGGRVYSVATVEDGVLKLKKLPHHPSETRLRITILCDVREGEKSWVSYEYQSGNMAGMVEGGWLEIHIPDVRSVVPSTWNRGKFGSGRIHCISSPSSAEIQ